MNANEARKMTTENLVGPVIEPLLQIAYKRIEEFATKGKYSVPHPFHGAHPFPTVEAIDAAIHHLRCEGYKAIWHEVNSTDPREYSYWEIFW